ncbi:hypothetical protein HFO06_23140 [Rhizobium leguminosarum]|uniref:Uncharacterized protein n=1 Tax=Rhizobium laguerreae TaxID=1076926 RepID=A0A6N9ZIP4_9HYPH|nr:MULTISPECIES: hypothetical protein [Rhizobium]MBY5765966.1 hypothetical protein [Rhizobium leguminosarum]NEH93141.1 hypothetical protein [Rhizobium laguerreae]
MRAAPYACLLAAGIIAVWVTSGFADQQQQLLEELQQRVRNHFRALPGQPIALFGANYHIGDTWDPSMTRLVFSSDRCFKGLKARESQFAIPPFHMNTDASVGFFLRLKRMFDLGASGTQAEIVDISFEDVTEELVEEAELKERFDAAQCAALGPVIGSKIVGDDVPPVVIGHLYRGKRRILLTYANEFDASARLDQLASVAGLSAGAFVRVRSGKGLLISDNSPVNLAFLPAFVPVKSSGTLGGGDGGSVTYMWTAFDLENHPSQASVLADLTQQVDANWFSTEQDK